MQSLPSRTGTASYTLLHVVHHVDYMAPAPTRGTFRFDKYMAVMAALRESGYPITEHAPPAMPRR